MNPSASQPHPRPPRNIAEDHPRQKLNPVSHSYLEPGREGILFAVLCLLCSAIIYFGVLLIRFLT